MTIPVGTRHIINQLGTRNIHNRLGATSIVEESRDIKGTVQRDFRPLVFSSLKPVWATDQQVKIFSILVKNSPSYTNFKFKNLAPQSMIPRRVSLPGV